jgi:hypothetical protein
MRPLVAYLASDRSLHVSGQVLPVHNGESIT